MSATGPRACLPTWQIRRPPSFATVNFFMNVPIAPNGELVVDDGISAPGSAVEMVADMDVLCVISNCPQVNNPCNGFRPTPVRVQILPAVAA